MNPVLPASPNWYCSRVFDAAPDGRLCFGAKNSLYVFDISAPRAPRFISHIIAHDERVVGVSLCPVSSGACDPKPRPLKGCSAGEDGQVKIWDLDKMKEIKSYSPHAAKLTTVHWCPVDEGLIASGDDRGGVAVYTASTEELWRWQPDKSHTHVFALTFSPHTRHLLAVGFKTGAVMILDLARKKGQPIVARLRGHDDEIHAIVWCPATNIPSGDQESPAMPPVEHLIATSSRDRTIRVWDTTTSHSLSVLRLPHAPPGAQGGRRDHRGGGDEPGGFKTRLWVALAWPRHRGEIIASGTNGELTRWNIDDPAKPRWELLPPGVSIRGHNRIVFNIAHVGGTLATISMDRQIVLWDLSAPCAIQTLSTLGGFVYSIAPSPLHPGKFAIGVGDNLIRVCTLAAGTPPSDVQVFWQGIRSKVTALAWHPTREGWLGYGTEDGRVGVLDVLSGKHPQISSTYHKKTVYVVTWGPPVHARTGGAVSGGAGYAGEGGGDLSSKSSRGNDAYFNLYSVGDGVILQHCPDAFDQPAEDIAGVIAMATTTPGGAPPAPHHHQRPPIRSEMSWSADFSLVAVGNEDGSVEVLRAPHLRIVCTMRVHRKLVNCVRWHPAHTAQSAAASACRHWLATGSNESVIHVFNLEQILSADSSLGREASLMERGGDVGGGNIGEGDVSLAGGKKDKFGAIGTAAPVVITESYLTLEGHTNRITALSWSLARDGLLASASYDWTAQVWDVAGGGATLANFRGHHGRLLSLAWGLEEGGGSVVYTGADDYTLMGWRVSEQKDVCPPTDRRKMRPKGNKIKNKHEEALTKQGNLAGNAMMEGNTEPELSDVARADVANLSVDVDSQVRAAIEAKMSELIAAELAMMPQSVGGNHCSGADAMSAVELSVRRAVMAALRSVLEEEDKSAHPAYASQSMEATGITASGATYGTTGETVNGATYGVIDETTELLQLLELKRQQILAVENTRPPHDACFKPDSDSDDDSPLHPPQRDPAKLAAGGGKKLASKAGKKKRVARSLFPKSSSADNRGKLPTQQDCVVLAMAKYGNLKGGMAGGPVGSMARGQTAHDKTADVVGCRLAEQVIGRLPEQVANGRLPESAVHLGCYLDRRATHALCAEELLYHTAHSNDEAFLLLHAMRGSLGEALGGEGGAGQGAGLGRLSDLALALAPGVSLELWEELCARYSAQLVGEGQHHKAAALLLSINRVYESVALLRDQRLYKDALCLARLRLPLSDPLLHALALSWAGQLAHDGNHELAAKCFLSAGEGDAAAATLARRGDVPALKVAAKVAVVTNGAAAGHVYAQKCVTEALVAGDWTTVGEVVGMCAEFGYLGALAATYMMIAREMEGLVEGFETPPHWSDQRVFTGAEPNKGNIPAGGKPLQCSNETEISQNERRKNDKDLKTDSESWDNFSPVLHSGTPPDPLCVWAPMLVDDQPFITMLYRCWRSSWQLDLDPYTLADLDLRLCGLRQARQGHAGVRGLLVGLSLDVALGAVRLAAGDGEGAAGWICAALCTALCAAPCMNLCTTSCTVTTLDEVCTRLVRLVLPFGPLCRLDQLLNLEGQGAKVEERSSGISPDHAALVSVDIQVGCSEGDATRADCLTAFHALTVTRLAWSTGTHSSDNPPKSSNGRNATSMSQGSDLERNLIAVDAAGSGKDWLASEKPVSIATLVRISKALLWDSRVERCMVEDAIAAIQGTQGTSLGTPHGNPNTAGALQGTGKHAGGAGEQFCDRGETRRSINKHLTRFVAGLMNCESAGLNGPVQALNSDQPAPVLIDNENVKDENSDATLEDAVKDRDKELSVVTVQKEESMGVCSSEMSFMYNEKKQVIRGLEDVGEGLAEVLKQWEALPLIDKYTATGVSPALLASELRRLETELRHLRPDHGLFPHPLECAAWLVELANQQTACCGGQGQVDQFASSLTTSSIGTMEESRASDVRPPAASLHRRDPGDASLCCKLSGASKEFELREFAEAVREWGASHAYSARWRECFAPPSFH